MKKVYKQGELLIREVNQTQIFNDTISFWNLGQAGILLKGRPEDGFIVIDPYLTKSIEESNPETEFIRAYSPVLSPEMLQGINGVVITHEHDDHMDLLTLDKIAAGSEDTVFTVPAPLMNLLGLRVLKLHLFQQRTSNMKLILMVTFIHWVISLK
jgi:L-ascorbate metabolism protein UlaG (beta-lactamase superfamily)